MCNPFWGTANVGLGLGLALKLTFLLNYLKSRGIDLGETAIFTCIEDGQ